MAISPNTTHRTRLCCVVPPVETTGLVEAGAEVVGTGVSTVNVVSTDPETEPSILIVCSPISRSVGMRTVSVGRVPSGFTVSVPSTFSVEYIRTRTVSPGNQFSPPIVSVWPGLKDSTLRSIVGDAGDVEVGGGDVGLVGADVGVVGGGVVGVVGTDVDVAGTDVGLVGVDVDVVETDVGGCVVLCEEVANVGLWAGVLVGG